MPAGVSWSQYLRFGSAALLSMLAGSQTVHYFYRPLDDLEDLVEQYYRDHPEIQRPESGPDKLSPPDPFMEALELNIKKKLEERKKL